MKASGFLVFDAPEFLGDVGLLVLSDHMIRHWKQDPVFLCDVLAQESHIAASGGDDLTPGMGISC